MGWTICHIAFSLLVVLSAAFFQRIDAATYVVGDSTGWSVPTADPNAYATWASQHTFSAGDILVFNFTTGQQDVARVTRRAFDSCDGNAPISLLTVGPVSITLNATQDDYFICTFRRHCALGQKLAINVTAPPPALAPTPTATSSPTPTATPAPSPQSTPSPAPSLLPPSPSPAAGGPGMAPSPPPSAGPASPEIPPPPGRNPPIPINFSPPPPPAGSASASAVASVLVFFVSVAIGVMC